MMTPQQRWKKRNPEKVREQNRRRLARNRITNRARLAEFRDRPCEDCGAQYPPAMMHCDHIQAGVKRGVSSIVASSPGRFERELAKCEVRCAQCHQERHA